MWLQLIHENEICNYLSLVTNHDYHWVIRCAARDGGKSAHSEEREKRKRASAKALWDGTVLHGTVDLGLR